MIEFIINTLFSSIWPIGRILSHANTLGQSELGSNGNEGVLHIPQSSSITGTLTSDCLVSYPGHSLVEGSYFFDMKHLVYFTAPADWAIIFRGKIKFCKWQEINKEDPLVIRYMNFL